MADIVVNKYCPACGTQMEKQSDGTYKCPVCGMITQGDFLNSSDNVMKG